MRLYNALLEYGEGDYLRAHMPGHKGKVKTGFLCEALKYDITEIDNYDNLHNANGVILESEKNAARLYKSEETHFLVNGSTVGLLSSILGVTDKGDEILISRNCHKSVYNAIEINELKSHYIYPKIISDCELFMDIKPQDIEKKFIDNPGIKAVVIVSPTYNGIVSDISRIAEIVHANNAVLIVDEAHGAHFGFIEDLPLTSVSLGADLVIQSVHKTLPAPTQTALLHINGNRIDIKRIRRNLAIYQTSSPSYLLMAGIDYCMNYIESDKNELFCNAVSNVQDFYKITKNLNNISCINPYELREKYNLFSVDPLKVIVSTNNSGINGKQLSDLLLNKYHIQVEMCERNYCLLIMTVMDDKDDYNRLVEALFDIDSSLHTLKDTLSADNLREEEIKELNSVIKINEAVNSGSKYMPLTDSLGMISADYIYLYPPGIPLIVPGEIISGEIIQKIMEYIDNNYNIIGVNRDKEIVVVWEKSFM